MPKPWVVGITGHSGSGKTHLVKKLIPLLKRRGLKVGTLKHAHHRIDLDRPGKDSWRHLKAGAEAVAVVGPKQVMTVRARTSRSSLEAALKTLPAQLDLVLAEGFHETAHPKIAVADQTGRIRRTAPLMAVVSDRPVQSKVPQFGSNEIGSLASFLKKQWRQR